MRYTSKPSKLLKAEHKAICGNCGHVMPIRTESELRWIRYACGQECSECHATALYLEGDSHLEESK